MTRDHPNIGSCLCGAVRVAVSATDNRVGACHCRMCRTWGGGPLLTIECEDAVGFEGHDNITVFDSSPWAERGFCRTCGTHLFYRLKKEGHYAIPAGLLERQEPLVLAKQVFIDEKPAFYSFANETECLAGAEVFAQYTQDPGGA